MYIIDKEMTKKAYENLAYEQCLMDFVGKEGEPVLFLWQNENSVVVGRNQNVYKECDLEYISKENIRVVRRKSGGGAVYHDSGNLNYSYICKEEHYNRQEVFKYISTALSTLGVNSAVSGRNDLLVGDRKISGAAFYKNNGVMLHHGCVLVNTDIEKMNGCLTPNKAKFKSKGIESVPSRVINLVEIHSGITVDILKQAIKDTIIEQYSLIDKAVCIDKKKYAEYKKEFSSKDFIFGQFSAEYETISKRFAWGNLEIGFIIDNEIVKSCIVESDMLYPDVLELLVKTLEGSNFNFIDEKKEELLDSVKEHNKKEIINDILDFLEVRYIGRR